MKRKKIKLPLVLALNNYSEKKPIRFHMPGHKGGKGILRKFKSAFQDNIFKWDVTEIPGLDNLYEPEGVIKKSQQLLAKLYDADESFFLVNGTSSGILAMLGSALNEGDTVIVPRSSHKSVMSGIVMTGANPVYVMPRYSKGLGIHTQVDADDVVATINEYPDAKAVLITNPNYQGFCSDIKKISKAAKDNCMLFLVDEAHGPHFYFNNKLPLSAGEVGADAWVQSPHKMLCSMTQSAWLHVKGNCINTNRVKNCLELVTTTSPSYILMASLDYSRAIMEKHGHILIDYAFDLANSARKLINKLTPFYCIGSEIKGFYGIKNIDTSRLSVNVSCAGYTGYEVENILRKKFNIYAEYADYSNVYFLTNFSNTRSDIKKLIKALVSIKKSKCKIKPINFTTTLPKVALNPRKAFLADGQFIPLKKSKGRIIKQAIVPYPPGIPLLTPGEIIEEEHIDIIENLKSVGSSVKGLKNNSICVIRESR